MKNTIKNILTITLCFLASFTFANNLQITNIQDLGGNKISFDISWENAWRAGTDFHDAVWVFVKYRPNNTTQWLHADITGSNSFANLETISQPDQKGIFVRLNTDYLGNISATSVVLQLGNIQGVFPDFKVFGIEMVYVPQGSFYLGDGAGGAEFRYHVDGDTSLAYHVTSENAIPDGSLEFNSNGTTSFQMTDVPAGYPKGYDDFYCMKYEITQKQYVDFLNTLTRTQQNTRTETDISTTTISQNYVMSGISTLFSRQVIRCDASISNTTEPIAFYCDLNGNGTGNEGDDGLDIACNFLSQNDLFAYLDWSALRPMSDFEYEKACRGPLLPTPREFVWGTTLTPAGTLANDGKDSETVSNVGSVGVAHVTQGIAGPLRVGFNATNSTSRSQSGATYYGIMNMGDNLNEVTLMANLGNEGKQFTGILGDGQLSTIGENTTSDWGDFDGGYMHNRPSGYSGYFNNTYITVRVIERAHLSHTGAFLFNKNNSRESSFGGRGVR